MEYSELIAARYSVRAYRPDPVEDEKLHIILEAARLAREAGLGTNRLEESGVVGAEIADVLFPFKTVR